MTMQAENQPQAARQSAVREMSDEELRIRVAELCGWRYAATPSQPNLCYYERGEVGKEGYERTDWGSKGIAILLPNYPADLNAIGEAIGTQVLSDGSWELYRRAIRLICKTEGQDELTAWMIEQNATARHRCEAFVLTLAPSLPAAVQEEGE